MSAIPVLEIGVWNAWTFMLVNLAPMPVLMAIRKGVLKSSMESYAKIHRTVYCLTWVLWIGALVYSLFLPLRLGTIWFYVGLPIALVGAVTYAIVTVSFVTTPIGEKPVTTGLYRYSRHPMYISQLVMFIGAGVACASWLFLLLTTVYTGVGLIYAGSEEQICLEKYGEAYRGYMEKTPKWAGVPKT